MVFASSSSVYGDNPELPERETQAPSPMSPYAVSKLAGKQYCQVFSKIYKMETVCLLYFNVFGPKQDPSSACAAVVPEFISAALSQAQPIICGDGEQARDFTYVSNVVDANLQAASRDCPPGTVMNIACGQRTSLNQLLLHLGEVLKVTITPKYEEARPGDVRHSQASIGRARELLGYEPVVAIADGLRKTAQWYRQRHVRESGA